jgi:hypothetical protein
MRSFSIADPVTYGFAASAVSRILSLYLNVYMCPQGGSVDFESVLIMLAGAINNILIILICIHKMSL